MNLPQHLLVTNYTKVNSALTQGKITRQHMKENCNGPNSLNNGLNRILSKIENNEILNQVDDPLDITLRNYAIHVLKRKYYVNKQKYGENILAIEVADTQAIALGTDQKSNASVVTWWKDERVKSKFAKTSNGFLSFWRHVLLFGFHQCL